MLSKKICIAIFALMLAACQNKAVTDNSTGTTPNSTGGTVSKSPNTGPVTLDGKCEQRSPDGYRDKIKLTIKENVVSELDWTANPRAGSCRFELKNFTQVDTLPTAALQSKKDKKCHVYVWQDDRHVTVAVYGCKKICKQNDRILPVLLEPKTGACKPAGNDNNIAPLKKD
jgi:hypothetical protein